MPGSKRGLRLAADANVLLSALIGGRAGAVLIAETVEEVFTTEQVIEEVREYSALLAVKRRLNPEALLLALASLPVTIVPAAEYRRKLPEARSRMGKRDPDDVELLALALHFRIAVWSNDRDFSTARIRWYTTTQLLDYLKL